MQFSKHFKIFKLLPYPLQGMGVSFIFAPRLPKAHKYRLINFKNQPKKESGYDDEC